MKVKMQPFEQEGIQMYMGVMRAHELLQVAKVDVWRQDNNDEVGYQRAPETGRIGKVARYLQKDPKPLMPTSILLSYRGGSLETSRNQDATVTVEIPENETLWIVDGQHRISGFEKAIQEFGIKRLENYLLPVVIVEFPGLEDEANQFRVINETMKKVRTDLARRILALRMGGLGSSERRELRESGRLWEAVAVEVIKVLSTDEDSPWINRIQSPNRRKEPSHVIRELSFSTSLKPILTEYPYRTWTPDRVAKLLKEYWKAWEALAPGAFQEPENYVLLKTPGVFSLHQLARNVMRVLREREITNPTKTDFYDILSDLQDYASAEFWSKDNSEGAALAGSMKGFSILTDTMVDRLKDMGYEVD